MQKEERMVCSVTVHVKFDASASYFSCRSCVFVFSIVEFAGFTSLFSERTSLIACPNAEIWNLEFFCATVLLFSRWLQIADSNLIVNAD